MDITSQEKSCIASSLIFNLSFSCIFLTHTTSFFFFFLIFARPGNVTPVEVLSITVDAWCLDVTVLYKAENRAIVYGT